ncbi:MAG: SDR family oxidoreductase [Pseudomonadota bacterium]
MQDYVELSRSVRDHVVLITGAASGMGRATAHLFAREGARVIVSDVQADSIQAVVTEIEQAGFSADGQVLDVAATADIEACVEHVTHSYGKLDVLINNAGLAAFGSIDSDIYPEKWQLAMNVMLRGPMNMIRGFLPLIRRSEFGRIINIASTEALGATPEGSPYTTAKTGLIGLTRGMANDLGREGITVNAICPGPIRTGLTEMFEEEHKQIFAKRRVPLRRYGIPEEVAHITLSVALPASTFLNGATIPVDGGLTIKNA